MVVKIAGRLIDESSPRSVVEGRHEAAVQPCWSSERLVRRTNDEAGCAERPCNAHLKAALQRAVSTTIIPEPLLLIPHSPLRFQYTIGLTCSELYGRC